MSIIPIEVRLRNLKMEAPLALALPLFAIDTKMKFDEAEVSSGRGQCVEIVFGNRCCFDEVIIIFIYLFINVLFTNAFFKKNPLEI